MSRNISDNGLSHDYVRSVLAYDPATGLFTWLKTVSSKAPKGSVPDGRDPDGYKVIMLKGKYLRQHRLAWFYMTGEWPVGQIDHRNGVRDDNRFCNLRECDSQDNNRNRGLSRNNTSGVSGVCKQQGKWMVRIRLQKGVRKFFGYFDDLELAELVASEARDKYHKEFSLCAR